MDCPVCPQTQLVMSERQGIEIDYCPKCRGVWLDRGELDKILVRSVAAAPAQQAPMQQMPQQTPPPRQEYQRGHGDRDRHHEREQKHYKKKSIWHELFD